MRHTTEQNTHPLIPDEERIGELLHQFRPQPSQRFYERMASAPWVNQNDRNPIHKKNTYLRLSAAFLALVLLFSISLAITFIPSARVAAEQIIHFFIPSSSNELVIHLTPASPTTLFDFTNPANFPLSVTEVSGKAGYRVSELKSLPANLVFIGARYEPSYNAVLFLFNTNDFQLIFTQRPKVSGQDVFSIGEGAVITMVKIGNQTGEYVLGGWKATTTQPAPSGTPGETLDLSAVWDNQLPQSTLRWQSDGMVYELRTIGEKIPPQTEIIDWANGLK